MTEHLTTAPNTTGSVDCTPADRVTKSLLGYGVIAGPLYVVVALTQAVTREGFDLGLHQWSLLANGGPGWIQIANFIVTGLMVVAFAVGLRRALTPGSGARWAPRLVAVYGASLIAAGIFRADPALGFPVGTPDGPGQVSWHGLLHFAAGGVGFTCLAIACLVMGRRYGTEGARGLAVFSRVTGVVFLAGFAMVASGGGSRIANLIFTAAVILVWIWMTTVAVDRYRRIARASSARSN
ncbi:MAG: DUF998 domain-containing protein [Nakamurella sp.]